VISRSRLDALDDGRGSHPAARAHRHEPGRLVLTLELVEQRPDQYAARRADRMSQSVLAVDESDTIESATEMMLDGGIRHLPVIRGDRLVGMVSIRDLLASYQH